MKKKILGVLLLVFSAFLLVGCSSKNDLNGKWYGVDAVGDKVLVLDVNGESGTLDFENKASITNIDTKHKTFSLLMEESIQYHTLTVIY